MLDYSMSRNLMKTLIAQLKQHKCYYLALAVMACVVWVMNMLTTLKGDEYVYALLPDDLRHHCQTLADYVRTIPTFYQGTNGRLADAFERLMASVVGKSIFNVFNTIMLVLLVEGIFTLAVGRRRALLALAMVMVLLLVAFPYPGETLMWMAGACNYLWSVTLTLWLLCWLRYAPPRVGWGTHAATMALALVAGGFNESTSLPCLLGLGLYYLFNPKQLTPLRRTALLGYALGLGMILLSPALAQRLQGGNSVNMDLSLVQMMSRRVLAIGYMTLRFVTPLAALWLMVRHWRSHGWRAVAGTARYPLLAGALLAALALGMVIERPYTYFVTLSMALVLHECYDWMGRVTTRQRVGATSVLLVVATGGAAVVVHKMAAYRAYDREVHEQIKNGPAQCVIEASQSPVSSRWVVPDVYDNSQPACAYRAFYAYYYGKENVQFLPTELLQRYRRGTLLQGTTPMRMGCSDPTMCDTLLASQGAGYALLRMPDHDTAINGMARVYYDDIEQVLGRDVAARRYLLGSLKDHVPLRPYLLIIDGKRYMVVGCEITTGVKRIELRRYDLEHKQWLEVTYTRQS